MQSHPATPCSVACPLTSACSGSWTLAPCRRVQAQSLSFSGRPPCTAYPLDRPTQARSICASAQLPAAPGRFCGRSSDWCSSTGSNRRLPRLRHRACRARSAQEGPRRTARAWERWRKAAEQLRRRIGLPVALTVLSSSHASLSRARGAPATRIYASCAPPPGVLRASRPLGVPDPPAAGVSSGLGASCAPPATSFSHTHSHGTSVRARAMTGVRPSRSQGDFSVCM